MKSSNSKMTEIFQIYQVIPLKYSFARNLYSSAFTSSSVCSPFAAFSSAIFFAELLVTGFSPKNFMRETKARSMGGGEVGSGRAEEFCFVGAKQPWEQNNGNGNFTHGCPLSTRPVKKKKAPLEHLIISLSHVNFFLS